MKMGRNVFRARPAVRPNEDVSASALFSYKNHDVVNSGRALRMRGGKRVSGLRCEPEPLPLFHCGAQPMPKSAISWVKRTAVFPVSPAERLKTATGPFKLVG